MIAIFDQKKIWLLLKPSSQCQTQFSPRFLTFLKECFLRIQEMLSYTSEVMGPKNYFKTSYNLPQNGYIFCHLMQYLSMRLAFVKQIM